MDRKPETDLLQILKSNTMIQQLIDRYKRFRTEQYLARTYECQYAFVGMGQHSLSNLYPVVQYLQIPIKYICVTSERKAKLIEKKFPNSKATTSIDEILMDDTIKGIFVSTSPVSQFAIAKRVLQSGNSLFVEKPPCFSIQELDRLIEHKQTYHSPVAIVGMQKRYAPAVQLLKKRIQNECLINYDLHYTIGAYPEGGAVFDLYIHPIDLVCYLFGKPEIITCQKVAPTSYLIMLRHPQIIGTMELSTVYTWESAEEFLKVSTHSGIYCLSQMDTLTYERKPLVFLGVPMEKIRHHNKIVEFLSQRNNFLPTLVNNQIYTQGFYNEIQAFANAVEGIKENVQSDLTSLRDTFRIMEELKKL